MKNILVATDLSERADLALARTISMAALHSARLTVLYVVDAGLPAEISDPLLETAESLIRRRLKEITDHKQIDVSVCVEAGHG